MTTFKKYFCRFPLPNGEIFTLRFVANENGYQPESPYLPVAPEFPHEIPQFVLDQIAFAEQQKQQQDHETSETRSEALYQ